jgi:hypothetical protein
VIVTDGFHRISREFPALLVDLFAASAGATAGGSPRHVPDP